MGDPVTDWFFRSALSASRSGSVFSLATPDGSDPEEAWWVAWIASWRRIEGWRGPDAVFVVALDRAGNPLRKVPPREVMARLTSCKPLETSKPIQQPPLEEVGSYARGELKAVLNSEAPIDRSLLSLVPWAIVGWEEGA